jgi:hypothetical protein
MKEVFLVVRPGGKVVVMAAAKRDRFDAFERLRDPSHASELTMGEPITLGTSYFSLLTLMSLRYFTNAFLFAAENPWASKNACACDRELWLCSMIFEQSAR